MNGDGRDDIVGFNQTGVSVATSFSNGDFVSFGAPQQVLASFGAGQAAGGWSSQDRFPRVLADVNGDNLADIVGFGNAGAYVPPGSGTGEFL